MANPEWDNYDPKRAVAIEALERLKRFLERESYSEYVRDALLGYIREIEEYISA